MATLAANPERPRARYLTKTDPNEKKKVRSVKLGHSGFSAGGFSAPDADWQIDYTTKDAGDGLWEIRPAKPLPMGEYGLFASAAVASSPSGGGASFMDLAYSSFVPSTMESL